MSFHRNALLASLPPGFARIRGRTDLGIAAVVLAPALMLLPMLPDAYESLESSWGLHFRCHVGIATLGLIAVRGAGTLGLVTGRLDRHTALTRGSD